MKKKKQKKSLDFRSFVEYAHVCTYVCMSACLYNREIEGESWQGRKMPKERGEGNKRGLGNIYNMKAQG